MDDNGAQPGAKQGELAERLRALEVRVAALEAAALPADARSNGPVAAASAAAAPAGTPAASLPGIVAVAGRCFLVLGGAFLVRAFTDGGALPRGAGVALGLVYASVWLVLAERVGRAGRAPAATAYGLTATAIVCPLVWEATLRLGVLSPAAAAAVLIGLTVASLTISSRWRLAGLAWPATLGIAATAFALLVATRSLGTFGLVLLFLAAASLAVSLQKGWAGLPWPAALSADLVVLQGAWIAGRTGGPPEGWTGLAPGTVVALALALPLPFLGGMLYRTLVRRRDPVLFDVLQSAAALVIGLGAATRLGPAAGVPGQALGVGVLLVAAALYGAAFRPGTSRTAFLVHSSAGLVLALAGSWLAAPAEAVAFGWAAAGLAAVLLTFRGGGELAAAHGAALLTAAAFASGLVAAWRAAFVAPAGTAAPFSPVALFVLLLSALATGALARRAHIGIPGKAGRLAALALAILSILGVAALAEQGLVLLFAAREDPARTAAVRSAILALAALPLAACRRVPAVADLSRLAYPLLAAGGLKLLAEDLPRGRPATLFVAFVLYGAVLMAVPRLLRSASTGDDAGRK